LSGITINRLTILGWNLTNISILILLATRLIKIKENNWVKEAQKIFSLGTNAYLVWTLFLIVGIPLLFR